MKTSAKIKENILLTATRLFYSQGYNSTGINQIIDEAGIARASLYNHFKSKEVLLHTYLLETHKSWFAQLHLHIDKLDGPKEKLLGMFDFRMKRQIANQFGGCPFLKASAEVPADDAVAFEIINENKMQFRDLILEILNEMPFKRNQLPKSELADTLYLLMEGATVTTNFQKNKTMMVRAKRIASLLLNA